MSPLAEIRCNNPNCDFRCTAQLPGEEEIYQLVDEWTNLDSLPSDLLEIYRHHTGTRLKRKYWGHSSYTVHFIDQVGVYKPDIDKELTIEGGWMVFKNT